MAKPGLDNVARVQFFAEEHPSLWLEVKGKKYALSQYSATFAVNEIPSATCVLATGEQVDKSERDEFEPAEKLAEELSGVGMADAKIWLDFDTTETDWKPPMLPGGSWRERKSIFEGYYAGLSYRRIGEKIQFTVSLVHKLVDLTFGSIFSAKMHPSNAASLINPAVAKVLGGCKGLKAGAQGAWTSTAFIGEQLPDCDFCRGDDVGFGGQLLKVLSCLAQLDLFDLPCAGGSPTNEGNSRAQHIIENVQSETGGLRDPLSVTPFDTAIASYVGKCLNSFRGITFWDLLVGKWCPDFMLSFVPYTSLEFGGKHKCYGNIIPSFPTIKDVYHHMYLEDYVDFEMKATQHKPLMAVGILAPFVSTTGAVVWNEDKQPTKGYTCIGGQYPEEPKGRTGQYLTLDAPDWFQQVLESSKGAHLMVKGGKDAMDQSNKQKKRKVTFESKKTQIYRVMDKIAHVYYATNALRGRVGSFGSHLRFDIPPGTRLKLNKGNVIIESESKQLPGDFHVYVNRVNYNINSDTPMAKTTFECSAIRNQIEVDEADYTLTEHPFVSGKWVGGEFVKDWSPPT